MLHGVLGIDIYPLGVGSRTARHHQVTAQIIRTVTEAVLTLHVSTAVTADIHLTARKCGATTTGTRNLQNYHISPGVTRLDGRTGTRRAKANNQHIGFHVPMANLCLRHRSPR